MTQGARIGIDLGGTKIEAVLLDDGGREVARRRVPTPRDDYAGTIEAIGALVDELEAAHRVQAQVGVGAPGAPSVRTGRQKNANSVVLNDRPLRADLESILGRKIRLANDADCLCASEIHDGAAADASVVFAVILGTGVGGAIAVDGKLLSGPNAIAGEWGHNPLPAPSDDEHPGPECWCGRTGCIETWLSGPGLAADHRAHTGEARAAVDIAARVGDDAGCARTLERYVDRLARGLGSIINIIDPEVIVLGGGLSQIDGLYERVPARWGRYVFSDTVDVRLVPAAHGDASGVRGAAFL